MATFQGLDLGPLELSALERRLKELRGEFGAEEEDDARHAGRARTAYEQLAGAPLPEQDAISSGIQQLFGDMGSIISRRPEFGERSREDIKQRGAMLLQQRIQNVQILRDRYMDEASKVGKLDPIKSLEYAEKVERQNKLLEQLHDKQMAQFGADAAMERTQTETQSRERIAEKDRNATLAAAMLRATTGGKDWTIEARNAHFTDMLARFVDPKTKKIEGRILPIYKAELLSTAPYVGQTERQWVSEMRRKLSAAKGNKPLSNKEIDDVLLARAQHTFPDTAVEGTTTEGDEEGTTTAPPAVPGIETIAPRPKQELVIETPTGRLDERSNMLIPELKQLYEIMSMPSRGVLNDAIKQRARARFNVLVRKLEATGARVRFPAPVVEGIEVQEYTDDFLNQEAR